jgi:hypothetical protein
MDTSDRENTPRGATEWKNSPRTDQASIQYLSEQLKQVFMEMEEQDTINAYNPAIARVVFFEKPCEELEYMKGVVSGSLYSVTQSVEV